MWCVELVVVVAAYTFRIWCVDLRLDGEVEDVECGGWRKWMVVWKGDGKKFSVQSTYYTFGGGPGCLSRLIAGSAPSSGQGSRFYGHVLADMDCLGK